ncbi:MAG: hypothetical protein ABW185_21645 [Sedimenticola sp.]
MDEEIFNNDKVVLHAILGKVNDVVHALPQSAQPHFVYYALKGKTRDEVLALHHTFQEKIIVEVKEESF